jgi:two-component sensor histidine kinase
MPAHNKRLLLNGYIVAIWATLALTLVLHLLQPVFRGAPPLHLFLVGIMLASWYGGFRAGFLATALSGLASAYFFTEPFLALQIVEDREQLSLVLFVSVGGLFSLVIAMLRRSELRVLQEMIRHKERLEQEIAMRAQAEVELQLINSELEQRVQERTHALRHNEEQIRESLLQKEMLLKEIHHRVKNNLQIVTSLLTMQAETQTDAGVRDQFQDCQYRIRSMALIHEQLYSSQDLKSIDFADYAAQLVGQIHRTFARSVSSVSVRVAIPPLLIDIDQALPLGLILNELVSNSFKHAFSESSDAGEKALWVTVEPEAADGVVLEVGDSGSGIPDDVDLERSSSLGLLLIRSLVMQLQGRLSVQRQPNTVFRVVLPRKKILRQPVGT